MLKLKIEKHWKTFHSLLYYKIGTYIVLYYQLIILRQWYRVHASLEVVEIDSTTEIVIATPPAIQLREWYYHILKTIPWFSKHIDPNNLNFGTKSCKSRCLFWLISKNLSKIFLKLIKTNNVIGEIWRQNSKSLCLCA